MEKKLTKEIKENAEKVLGISLEEYVEACKQFAQDTKEYMDLNPRNFYATGHGGDHAQYSAYWYASNDWNQGGVAVEWAFNKKAQKIEEDAWWYYMNAYEEALDLLENP